MILRDFDGKNAVFGGVCIINYIIPKNVKKLLTWALA